MLMQHKLAVAASLCAFALAAGAQTAAAPATQAADAQQAPSAAQSDSAIVKAAFKRADANGDGKLSREEAAALPAVAEKFTQLDKNSDGFIAADEFEAGVTTQPPATK
jgi:Ca2+-binding EF-hand superfamily protein